MANITLSKAVRSNLLNLQAPATQMGKTWERPATGKKVTSALDNPTNFFTASALSSRASDLGQLLDSVSNAVQTIQAADKGISAITKLVESAQATARQAQQSALEIVGTPAVDAAAHDPAVMVANPKRAELVEQYNELLSQIDDLAKDSGFNGVNLLANDDLSVLFNEDGSSRLDIEGETFDAAGIGLTTLAPTAFDTNSSITSTLDDLKASIETLRTQASKLGANLSVVETRQDFTKNMINVLETGAANLTLADTNEEAANLRALQTRQQLSSTALSLASQADQNVLSLF